MTLRLRNVRRLAGLALRERGQVGGGIIIPPVPPLAISGTPASTGQVGFPYSFQPTVTGGNNSGRSFSLTGSLLAGLSFSSSTGAISGSPTAAGTMTGLAITVSEPGLTSATLNFPTVTISAGSATQTPLTIAPSKVLAWFDATDVATMFQSGTTPIVPNGTSTERSVGVIRAKTSANPAGDAAWTAVQATQSMKPVYGATAYAGGLAAGITHATGQLLCMRNKSIGGTNTLTTLMAVRVTAAGALGAFVLADARGGLSGQGPGGAYYLDEGGYISFKSGSAGETGTTSPANVTQNYEFAADSGTYRIYRGGTQIASVASSNVFDNPLDFSIFNDGGYQNDGVTVSRPNNGAAGSWQHIILLSSPLSASERTAMQTWLVAQSGGTSYATELDSTNSTGSIASGSNVLTVASGTGFANGKRIGIEPTTGYGTIGPGGYWPGQGLATDAAVLAATTSVSGQYMAALSSGKVYKPKPDGSGYFAHDPASFYDAYMIPLPLYATIQSGGGTTSLTLTSLSNGAAGASAAVSGTIVAVDNEPVFAGLNGPDNATFRLKAAAGSAANGPFRRSGQLTAFSNKKNWTIEVDGYTAGMTPTLELRSFRGGLNDFFNFFQCISPTVRGIKMRGNFANDGRMGLGYTKEPIYGHGVSFTACNDFLARDCQADDLPDFAFGAQNGSLGSRGLKSEDGLVDLAGLLWSCRVTRSTFPQRYLQWQINFVGFDASAVVEDRDCSFDSDWLTPAQENFLAEGSRSIRLTSRNGEISRNTCKGFYIEDPTIVITALSRDTTGTSPISPGNPVMNINNNAGDLSGFPPGTGGRIKGANIDIQGHVDAAGNVPPAIVANNPSLIVEGGFSTTSKAGTPRGVIRAPWAGAGKLDGSADGPRIGCSGGAVNTVIKNVRLLGYAFNGSTQNLSGRPEIDFEDSQPGASARTSSTIQDTVTGTSAARVSTVGTMARNISNAAYTALP